MFWPEIISRQAFFVCFHWSFVTQELAAMKEHYLKTELYALIQSDISVFDFIQQASLDGMWYWDLEDPEHEWMSAGFWQTLGYDPEEMQHLASEWKDIVHPDDLKVAVENFEKHIQDPGYPYDQIVRYTHKNGSTVWIRCRGMAIRNKQGKAIRMFGAHNDVSAVANLAKEVEQNKYVSEINARLKKQATEDFLTGLLNRRGFDDRYHYLLNVLQRNCGNISVALVDLDNFKRVNDHCGHEMGDKVLVEVAQVMKRLSRDSDIVCRYGGDEFIWVMPHTNQQESIVAVERIRRGVKDIGLSGVPPLSVSCGLTTFAFEQSPVDVNVQEVIFAQADRALYRAKELGKDLVTHFFQFCSSDSATQV